MKNRIPEPKLICLLGWKKLHEVKDSSFGSRIYSFIYIHPYIKYISFSIMEDMSSPLNKLCKSTWVWEHLMKWHYFVRLSVTQEAWPSNITKIRWPIPWIQEVGGRVDWAESGEGRGQRQHWMKWTSNKITQGQKFFVHGQNVCNDHS